MAIPEVILYYVEVILDNFLDFDKKSPRHISKIRFAEPARLKKHVEHMDLDLENKHKFYRFSYKLPIHCTAAAMLGQPQTGQPIIP